MPPLSDHAKGLLITATGVLAITPDSLLIRLVDTDVWSLVFWRGLLMGGGLGLGLILVYRRATWARCRAIGWAGLFTALLFTNSTVCFVTALAHTTVANTLIIISAAPLFSAFYSRLFLRESVPPRTWAAILASLGGIAIVVWGSLATRAEGGGLLGDLAALGTATTLAGSFTMMRRSRAVSMVPATALSAFCSALIALALGAPAAIAPAAWPALLTMGLVVLPVSVALITLGPRYLPAAEVGLLMLLETVIGPFWVWLVLHEEPSGRALAGGAVVLAALVLHAVAGLRARRTRGDTPALPASPQRGATR